MPASLEPASLGGLVLSWHLKTGEVSEPTQVTGWHATGTGLPQARSLKSGRVTTCL